jgi:hypothetical protein
VCAGVSWNLTVFCKKSVIFSKSIIPLDIQISFVHLFVIDSIPASACSERSNMQSEAVITTVSEEPGR